MVRQRLSKGEGMCPHHQVWGGRGADDAILGLRNIFRCQKVILLPVSCVERMVVEQRVVEGRESMELTFSSMCPQYNPGTRMLSNYVFITHMVLQVVSAE